MQTFHHRLLRGGPALLALILGLHFLAGTASAQLKLPAVPTDGNFIQDYANVLNVDAENNIGRNQSNAWEDHDTPIMVVTVGSMAEYGGEGYSIERFANEWFNHWQIGKRGDSDQLINKGILLLISVGDRKARIELGADWGNRYDEFSARIMNDQIVPQFKQGDYSAGALAGVEGLAEMATMDPSAQAPGPSFISKAFSDDKPLPTSPLPAWGMALMVLAGVALIGLSFVMPEYRKWLLIVGIGLIVSAFLLWVVLVIIGFFLKGRSGNNDSGGGFSVGGGGFSSGGFSGGGGASGSW